MEPEIRESNMTESARRKLREGDPRRTVLVPDLAQPMVEEPAKPNTDAQETAPADDVVAVDSAERFEDEDRLEKPAPKKVKKKTAH